MEIKINLKIFAFVAIFYLTGQLEIYGILMAFAFLHELGHLFMGLILKFKPKTMRIMPLGLAISFQTFPKDYNTKIKKTNQLTIKEMIIALAGPITNFALAFVFLCLPIKSLWGMRNEMIYANLLVALFNLLPIYPLDGGRVLQSIFYIQRGKEKALHISNDISNFTIILLTMLASILVLLWKNVAILFVLAYLWYLVLVHNRYYKDRQKLYHLIKNHT